MKLIGKIFEYFNFPAIHSIRVPSQRHIMYHRPAYKEEEKETETFWVGVSRQNFRCGLRMPLNKFLIALLNQIDIGIGQLAPNCFTTINAFLTQCIRRDIDPTLKFFWYTFRLGRDSQASSTLYPENLRELNRSKSTQITKGGFLIGALSTVLISLSCPDGFPLTPPFLIIVPSLLLRKLNNIGTSPH